MMSELRLEDLAKVMDMLETLCPRKKIPAYIRANRTTQDRLLKKFRSLPRTQALLPDMERMESLIIMTETALEDGVVEVLNVDKEVIAACHI